MVFKDVQYCSFRLLKFLVASFDWFRLKVTGSLEKQRKFETSAKISTIMGRFKYHKGVHDYHYGKEDFFYVHERFDHPDIILKDSVTLLTVTPDEAVFVDCGGFDVFSREVAFMYISQYEKASKLILLPIQSFHRIASQIPVPKASILHIGNHGRCGSTLMYRMFQSVPSAVSMSEPYAFVALTEHARTGALSKTALRTYCKSIIKCTIKHANDRQSDLVCLGVWSVSIFIANVLYDAWPTMKHIYMYRQPVPFTRSWEKLQVLHNWPDMDVELLKKRCGITETGRLEMFADYPIYTNDYLRSLSRFGQWALHWITCNAAYNSIVKRDYPIVSFKFEEFLKDPEKMISLVFKYFQIPLDKLPDVNKVLTADSQVNSQFSSQKADQDVLKKKLSPITDELREEVNKMCGDFNVPMFWNTDVRLANNILELSI